LHKTLINKDTVTHMLFSSCFHFDHLVVFQYDVLFSEAKEPLCSKRHPCGPAECVWMSRISANGFNGCWVISHWCRPTHWVCSSQWDSKSPWSHRDWKTLPSVIRTLLSYTWYRLHQTSFA